MLRIILLILLPFFMSAQCTVTVNTTTHTGVYANSFVSFIQDTTSFTFDEGQIVELAFLWADTTEVPTITGAEHISPYRWKVSCESLPVELIRFGGIPFDEGLNALYWSTGAEDAFDYFDLEKSTNGKDWYYYKRIDSKGSNSDYEIMDTNAIGDCYYRLKQVDLDRSFEMSKVISIKSFYQPTIIPNPLSRHTRLDQQYHVVDQMGRYMGRDHRVLKSGYYIFTTVDGMNFSQPIYIK